MCKKQLNPVYCIVPPYMLNKLAESKNSKISDLAINSSFRSSRFRSDRSFFRQSTLHERSILGIIGTTTGPATLSMKVYDCRHKTDFSGAKKIWDSKSNKKSLQWQGTM